MERINGNGAHAPIESTVVVIDDNATSRQATAAALEGVGFHVKAFPTGRSFLDNFNGRASCILLELRLRDVSGMEVLKALNEKMNVVPVIVTSSNPGVQEVVEAMRGGAHNVLETPIAHNVLIDSVRQSIAQYGLVSTIARGLTLLSSREREVLRRLLDAKSTKNIARELTISPKTVEKHRANILAKFQADSQSELILRLLPINAAGSVRNVGDLPPVAWAREGTRFA